MCVLLVVFKCIKRLSILAYLTTQMWSLIRSSSYNNWTQLTICSAVHTHVGWLLEPQAVNGEFSHKIYFSDEWYYSLGGYESKQNFLIFLVHSLVRSYDWTLLLFLTATARLWLPTRWNMVTDWIALLQTKYELSKMMRANMTLSREKFSGSIISRLGVDVSSTRLCALTPLDSLCEATQKTMLNICNVLTSS